MHKILVLYLVLFRIIPIKPDSDSLRQLKNKVLTNNLNYDKNISPSDLVVVYLEMSFKQFVGIDDKNQIDTTTLYLIVAWTNQRLTWNSTEIGNLPLMFKANLLWLPDLYVINTGDSNWFITVSDSNLAELYWNGKVKITFALNGMF